MVRGALLTHAWETSQVVQQSRHCEMPVPKCRGENPPAGRTQPISYADLVCSQSAHEPAKVGERLSPGGAHPLVVVLGALDLVVIDGDPRHVRAAGRRDGPHRPADAAADVQGPGPGLEPQDARDPRLMGRL